MQDTLTRPTAPQAAPPAGKQPMGFHHHSWVVTDHARTRAFYEGLLGIPLIAFWIESDNVQGEDIEFGHAFYGLQDGSRLSFFNVAGEKMAEKYKSPKTEVFNHIAMHVDAEMQARYTKALQDAGVFNFTLEHGYCRSLYTMDPDGLRLEFAVDSPQVETINADQLANAHDSMTRWLAGDRRSNNPYAEKHRGSHGVA